MKIRLKGMNRNRKDTPRYLRGRSYDIGTINAGVQLTDNGLILLINDKSLAEFLKKEFELRKFKGVKRRKK
jgi:hypothetical protein